MKRVRASLIGLVVAASCGREPTTPVTQPVTPPAQQEMPTTGTGMPGMTSFDQRVRDLMRQYGIPGGAVALVRDGKLIYARGFGYADAENKTPVQPDALFRIASVSKPITSAAIMKLVEDGKLGLDDRVAPLIADLKPAPGAKVDPRWEQITIRHLLNHTGGWDRDKPNGGFDPMFQSAVAAAAVGAPAPASAETIIRYMKGMPLDFDPGTKWAYSNFGYDILGRVIERLSGMPYEEFVRTRVLQPAGANRTRVGKTRMKDALADEVRYYYPGAALNWPLVPSVFPGEGIVPANYGGYYLEATDSHGGWVSSTVDLLRFLTHVDGRASPADILSPQLVAEMTGSGATTCPDGSCYYAAGWWVRPGQGDATWWHGGDYPGTKGMLVRSANGFAWVALFNAGAPNSLVNELDAALWNALGVITSFPTHDLFSSFR
ncbi:beta-lactamase (plasmid) [Gemmatirosa kalamazoonensis]|uniref:Beta-lactamase n=2 Tax=Gemmatirosa kalamazoonensis TaxID=861299 RepID=W0RS74_9BACT|nr:beta-lactamase [Gemmatirosa kalamazoonensis]